MPYESPYQSMVENEVLFQQQPWLKRIPHQIRHAVRPVEDALTGAGAGVVAGTALGSPRAGAVVGGVLGGLHGVLSRTPTAAQEWAFNNPELVHVLKARAAYDAGDGFEMGKAASWEKLAVSPEWVGARLESLKDSTDPKTLERLTALYDRTDDVGRMTRIKADNELDKTPIANVSRGEVRRLASEGHPDAVRYTQLDRRAFRLFKTTHNPIARAIARIEVNQADGEVRKMQERTKALEALQATGAPERQERAKALLASRAAEPTPPPGASYLQTVAPLTYAVEKSEAANAHASEVSQAFIRMGEKMDARAAATPKAPTPAAHAPAAAPKSNLRRNLGIGAAAVAIPTLAYTAYRHFADKPDAEKAREAGKTAMLRTLGF